jgi:hypothetical protein
MRAGLASRSQVCDAGFNGVPVITSADMPVTHVVAANSVMPRLLPPQCQRQLRYANAQRRLRLHSISPDRGLAITARCVSVIASYGFESVRNDFKSREKINTARKAIWVLY